MFFYGAVSSLIFLPFRQIVNHLFNHLFFYIDVKTEQADKGKLF